MTKLSVVISAYNEEKKIADCLSSVKNLADEIILVNSGSTDKTVEIAKKFTKKIYDRPNNPMLNVNKNFGFTKAKNEWILCLDADERVTPELADEIRSTINNERSTANGFWIPRKNIIFGKWIEHSGWYPDYQLRLFKKGKGKFPEDHVHEMIEVEGETEKLTSDMLHYNYDTLAQFLKKLTLIYVPNEADVLIKKGYEFAWIDVVRFPFREFLNRYFGQMGYKDGLHGLTLSLLMAFYHLLIFVSIWEKKGFVEVGAADVLPELEKERRNIAIELHHWFSQMKPKSILSLMLRKFKK